MNRKDKILTKKKLEKNEILANLGFFATISLNKIQEEETFAHDYQRELKKLESRTTIVQEDHNSKLSYLYFKYHYINYTQCFYYESLDHSDLLNLVNFLSIHAYFSDEPNQKINYLGKEIEVTLENSQITSITLNTNEKYYFSYNENFENPEDFAFPLDLSTCFFYNLTTQAPEPTYSLSIDESLSEEIYSNYKTRFLSQYDTLLINIPNKNDSEEFALSFDFCGNWCGPHYGGLDDTQCQDICSLNLDLPSQECVQCRPPLSDVDSICMTHDFCCKKTYQINQNICGGEVFSYDCDCHRNMRKNLAKIEWNLHQECNFVKKVMMEIAFTFLNCRCRSEIFGVKFDKCVPLFLCPE